MEEFGNFPWIFPAFFVFVWLFALSAIARFGGWSLLAEHYATDADAYGPKRPFQSLMLRRGVLPTNLNSVVTVGAEYGGLRLSMFVLFRPSHPPLLIPWNEIAATDAKTLGVFPAVALRAQRAPEIELVLAPALAQWLAENSGGQFVLPAMRERAVA